MTALSDYLLSAHIGYVNASIRGETGLPFRPLAKLPEVFNGVNAQADARARDLVGGNAEPCSSQGAGNGRTVAMPEISTGHPTQPTRKDAQPSRAVSPNPATNTNTPGA